jgi:hypothetical protein
MDTRPGEPGSKGVAGKCEWYSVWDYLWQEAGMQLENEMLWSSGFLCIGCLEKRLGRELTAEDFVDAPINHQHDLDTPRLASRKNQHKKTPIITAEPKYPVKKLTWWIIRAIDAGIISVDPSYIDEEDFAELGAPEWVWLAFQEELKEYFNIPDDPDDAGGEVPAICPHCRMAGLEAETEVVAW